jgi:hypothetical protein
MPDLIPAKDGIVDRHAGYSDRAIKLDSLHGEFIEPRVKPGMTNGRRLSLSNVP